MPNRQNCLFGLFFATVFLLLGLMQPAMAEMQTAKFGTLDVVYWTPPEGTEKQPLLLYSHGFRGCATNASYLMQALAEHGYWVFAANHQDTDCGPGTRGVILQEPLSQPEDWTDKTYADRGDDIHMLLDGIQHDPTLSQMVDFSRVGLIGHSLGGYTMLGLAGAWQSWKPISNVKAVLALAPYSEPYSVQKTLGNVHVPVMYQTGTRDAVVGGITEDGGAYDQTPKPKYLIELDRATHIAWSDGSFSHRQQIIDYASSFLDHYVKGLPPSASLTAKATNVEVVKYDSEIGSKKD